MAISNELTTLKANISNAYNAIQAKGGTIPTNKNTQNLSNAINTIQGGGGVDDYLITTLTSSKYKIIQLIKAIPPMSIESNVTDLNYMFNGCSSLLTIPSLDTSNVTNMSYMFNGCMTLTTIPLLDTSNVTDMTYTFGYCSSLLTIPLLDTSKVTDMTYMFFSCKALTTIPSLDTSNVTNMSYMFNGCKALTTIPSLDTSNATNITHWFDGCNNLENIGGFQNLGNAYSKTSSAGYSRYELNFSSSKKLTHDSLMNVINKLYDIKTKGCKAQKLVLGTDNKAKLTAEEIAIATNKGWTVS